jgi:hypothetical protein
MLRLRSKPLIAVGRERRIREPWGDAISWSSLTLMFAWPGFS